MKKLHNGLRNYFTTVAAKQVWKKKSQNEPENGYWIEYELLHQFAYFRGFHFLHVWACVKMLSMYVFFYINVEAIEWHSVLSPLRG